MTGKQSKILASVFIIACKTVNVAENFSLVFFSGKQRKKQHSPETVKSDCITSDFESDAPNAVHYTV